MSRNIVAKRNNNCEKRGGGFFFIPTVLDSTQRKISRKNVFVPWGMSCHIQFLPKMLLKGNLKAEAR